MACSDVSEINYENLSIDEEDLWLMDVQELADGTILVSGGKLWNSGALFQLDGTSLINVLDTSKTLVHIEQFQEDVIAVGFDAYFFRRKANNLKWNFTKLPDGNISKIFKGVAVSQNRIIAVGGHAFMSGTIYTLDQNLEVIQTKDLENELSSVAHVQDNTWIAVGFGIVLRSTDNGETWNALDITGDFYKDIQFVSNQVGYILGQSGTILKTTNGGIEWEEIRSQSDFEKVSGFNEFEFVDENNAVIIADDGQIFQSEDAGQSWNRFELKGAPDLLGLHYSDKSSVYVCGKNGFLARFSF